ncbi:MAG: hypothetical protein ACTS5A_03850 [Candidatus Hodgkinia cicadicola]
MMWGNFRSNERLRGGSSMKLERKAYDWWIQPRCFGRSKDGRTAEAGCLRDVSEHQWIAQSCKMVLRPGKVRK